MTKSKTVAKKTTGKTAKTMARHVVVTTAHRGVFYGVATDTSGETIALTGARLCIFWARSVKGFMGLAATGPNSECRIGPAADIELRNITSVIACTPEAVEAWQKAPWSNG